MPTLTESQMEVLGIIAQWIQDEGRSPSLREIGLRPRRSVHAVEKLLVKLEEAKVIRVRRSGPPVRSSITIEPMGVAMLQRKEGYEA